MKVAAITGAGRGIGAAMARTFSAEGYAVALVDIDRESIETLATELGSPEHPSVAFSQDLSDLSRIRTLIDSITSEFGGLDVLINNAATRDLRPVSEISADSWNHIISVNLTAPALLAQAAIPPMLERGGGVIINIASVEATIPKGVSAAYAAAKGGLISLTFDSAAALAAKGIRVIALSPGAVDTLMGGGFDEASAGADPSLDRDIRSASEDLIPAKRWARPDEIARVALWLASDDASYITGTEIVVDGGLSHTWMSRGLKNRIIPGQFE